MIEPCDRDVPEEYSLGTKPDVRADRAPCESLPVTDLDRQPEPGQRRNSAQTSQPAYHRRVGTVLRNLLDRRITAVSSEQHRLVVRVERRLQSPLIEPLTTEPHIMRTGPRRALSS